MLQPRAQARSGRRVPHRPPVGDLGAPVRPPVVVLGVPAAAKPPSSTAPSDIQFARAAEAAPAASPVSARVMIGLVLGDGPAARQPGGAQALRAVQAWREPRQDARRPRGCRSGRRRPGGSGRRHGRPRGGCARATRRRRPRSAGAARGRRADPDAAPRARSPARARRRAGARPRARRGRSGSATRVNRCGAVSTSPSSRRRLSASRTGVRLRPSQPHSSSSCSGSPGARVPSTIASQTFS